MVWRYTTAGESHGPAVVGLLEGMPAGLPLGPVDVDPDLARRQVGYGRGARMAIETDKADFLGGVRFGKTTGAPLALLVRNRGREEFTRKPAGYRPLVLPRPGHTDLAGALKFGTGDMRDVLERASARETAVRVALGACARKLLASFGITVRSLVESVGSVEADRCPEKITAGAWRRVEKSPLRCPDGRAEKAHDEAHRRSPGGGRHRRRPGDDRRRGGTAGTGEPQPVGHETRRPSRRGAHVAAGGQGRRDRSRLRRRPPAPAPGSTTPSITTRNAPSASTGGATTCRRPGGGDQQRGRDRLPPGHEADTDAPRILSAPWTSGARSRGRRPSSGRTSVPFRPWASSPRPWRPWRWRGRCGRSSAATASGK